MLRLLIAGGNGHIGSYLSSCFKNDIDITSIDFTTNRPQKNSYFLDLTMLEQVKYFVDQHEKFNALIFLVGLAHEKGKGADLPIFTEVNYQTLINLLSSLKSAGKMPEKIIFSSTISVYGERKSHDVYVEESTKNPVSPYAVTKLMAEKYLLTNFKDRAWIMRLSPVYSSSFMLNISRRTKYRERFYKVGNGTAKLSLCNLNNIVGVIDGIFKDSVPNGVYNISDPIDYCYDDLIKIMGGKEIIRIPRALVKLSYLVGKLSGNIFLKENSVKLLTDNTFSSDKIGAFVNLTATIKDIEIKR